MKSSEIRQRFLKFFEKRGHAVIPSSPLVPENDPTTLFTGSGMQPMVPYLLGESHPLGTRIADSQKSFRTVDIDEVGDNRHTTFFEMLGNWSLGDYFKKEQIEWMFQFLTEEIKIDPNKLYVTAFMGDDKNSIPKDIESAGLWKKLFAQRGIEAKEIEIGSEENGYQVGMQGGRIFFYDAKKNWWSRAGVPEKMPAGEPGGPDSEMFYEFTDVPHDEKFGKFCHPNCDCGRFLEIGNNVFMEYKKNSDGTFSKLPKNNVDFGGGLERLVMAATNCPDIIRVNYQPIIEYIESACGKKYGEKSDETRAFRIIADHMKASVFLIADGVIPSNADQGYYVRRLLRRAVRFSDFLDIDKSILSEVVDSIALMYKDSYPEVYAKSSSIKNIIAEEENRFRETLSKGLKEFEKGTDAFTLFSSYGFPLELTLELAKEKGLNIDIDEFKKEFKKHQDLSRSGAEKKFKGGLADTSEMSVKYHTATHLLHQALHDVLGEGIMQKGSNITPERLRFDFSHGAKMTGDEIKKVEYIVNQKIKENLPVNKIVLPTAEAEKTGARHFFGEKYGDQVSVYYIGKDIQSAYAKEFCGGPHVENIGNLGTFKIQKEEAVSQGVRRIKAVLQ
ncbi:MAG: alanine--tRNA ligase [bacterium]|nr:alanine--tRNA ligase [bacterium]